MRISGSDGLRHVAPLSPSLVQDGDSHMSPWGVRAAHGPNPYAVWGGVRLMWALAPSSEERGTLHAQDAFPILVEELREQQNSPPVRF